jgi:hypothetical protein
VTVDEGTRAFLASTCALICFTAHLPRGMKRNLGQYACSQKRLEDLIENTFSSAAGTQWP